MGKITSPAVSAAALFEAARGGDNQELRLFIALNRAVQDLIRCAAQDVVMPRYRQLKSSQVTDKSVGELVTVADLECEAMLAEGLARFLPSAVVLGEEAISADPALARQLGDRLCWIVDPLDGTNNFVRGDGPFGIMVALADSGRPVAGWIYDPVLDRMCSAGQNAGAWVNGKRVRATSSGAAKPKLAISTLFADADRRSQLSTALRSEFEISTLPRCAAEIYPGIVAGGLDVVLFGRTLAWDHAAGAILLSEASGYLTRLDGSDYRVDGEYGLVAAVAPELASRVLGAIAV